MLVVNNIKNFIGNSHFLGRINEKNFFNSDIIINGIISY